MNNEENINSNEEAQEEQGQIPSIFQKEFVQSLIDSNIEFVRCMPDDRGIILFTNSFIQVPFFIIMDEKLQIDILFMISKNQYSELITHHVSHDSMSNKFPTKPTLEWEIKTLDKQNPEFKSNPFVVSDLLQAYKNYCGVDEINSEKHLIIGFEFLHENYDFKREFTEELENFANQLKFPYDKNYINLEKDLPRDESKSWFDESYINEFIIIMCNILNRELKEVTRVSGCQQER